MSTIDEVLAAAEVVDAVCVIDGETRIISVPAEYKELGVESDEKVTRVKFQCPKIVGDNIDLTECNLYINYRNAGNKLNSYLVEDVTVTGDTINFSWLLSRHVTENPGTISYIVCAKKSDDTGVINEWNTKVATGIVGIGLEATEEIEEQNIDAIEQILRSIVELENKVDGGGSGGSSIAIDETLTKSGQAADAKATGDAIRSLSEEIVTTSESKVAAHNTGTDTHSDIRLLIQGLTDRLNALADSDDTTLDQLSEVVTYIKSNRSLIEAITTGKVGVADIVDNLTTNASNKPLSAAQGVVIKTLIDALRNDKLDAAELTNAVNTALAQAKASGEFDGADGQDGQDGKPGKDGITPAIGSNGNWYLGAVDTGKPSRGVDGKDYILTDSDKTEIAQLVITQLGGDPVFGTVDTDGNITIKGALSAGKYTVAYTLADGTTINVGSFTIGGETPSYTNLYHSATASINKRVNSSGVLVDAAGFVTTDYIAVADLFGSSPIKIYGATNAGSAEHTAYIKGATFYNTANCCIAFCNSSKGQVGRFAANSPNVKTYAGESGDIDWAKMFNTDSGNNLTNVAYIRFCVKYSDSALQATPSDIIITVDEAIE